MLTIGLNRAVSLLAEAKTGPRRGPQLLREIGPHPEGGTIGLYRGRYGPYVSHDGVHASLPKGADPDKFSLEAAVELLATQRAKGKAQRQTPAAPRARPRPRQRRQSRQRQRPRPKPRPSPSVQGAVPRRPEAGGKANAGQRQKPRPRKRAKRTPRSAAGE